MSRIISGVYTRDFPSRRTIADADGVTKTRIAAFSGPQFTAEREGGELVIYQLSDGDGVPGVVVSGVSDHGRITSVHDLASFAKKHYR